MLGDRVMTNYTSFPIHKSFELTDPLTCGLGGDLQLSVAFDPPCIQLPSEMSATNLCGAEWVYGFDPKCEESTELRLRFVSKGERIAGYSVELDSEGRWVGTPVELGDENGVLVYACARPTEAQVTTGQEPCILLFFASTEPGTIRMTSTERSGRPKPWPQTEPQIEPPTEAQPKLILRPKRNCPTGDGKSGPTLIT
jgi:hypothetical protein